MNKMNNLSLELEQAHELSILLGSAFAQAYKIDPTSDKTDCLLEMYKESRRALGAPNDRPNPWEAYRSTQGDANLSDLGL